MDDDYVHLPGTLDDPFEAITGSLKPKVASKNPRMGDYVQKKGFGKGFYLIYMATIFL